jgi:protein-disulfide isomerase-like protein with CxxC motif
VTLTFDVSFDYRCPFAKNIHLHVIRALRDGADFDVTFVPWTLSQGGLDDDATPVWDDPTKDAELLSLAVGVSIRDEQPEKFLDAHEALFIARHVSGHRLVTMDEITEVLEPVGVDTRRVRDDLASRRPHKVIGASYREFERYEAFGVPTFVANDDAVFVRYMTAPAESDRDSTELITALVAQIGADPAINEFKHTRLPA